MRNLSLKGWKQLFLLACCLSLSWATMAQGRKVSGKVTDSETGSPMPGVTVLVKGSNAGANTDGNGAYSLNVPDKATIVFSFVGYATQEVAVGNRTTLNLALAPDAKALQEVVVTGYAAQAKKDITGAVAVVDVKEMKKVNASNIADQLQGRIAGVQVSSSGDPGSAAFVRIRGIGSINQNEPLYVIDGVPVQNESNLNFLNPNDIESMQVLKDAASASIYGSRAANGVVVITTKKGKAGTSKINVDVFTGIQQPTTALPMANPTELLQINEGLSKGAGIPFESPHYVQQGGRWVLPDWTVRGGGFRGGVLSGDPRANANNYFLNSDPTADANANYLIQGVNKEGTDWFGEVFKPAPVNSVQLSASGGSERGNYFFSTNYYKHDGIMIKNNYTRYQMRMNSTFNVKKNVRVGESFSVAYQTTVAGMGNPNEGSALKNSYSMIPFAPVYDINGYWAGSPYGNASNPVAQQHRAAEGKGYSMRLTGNMFAEVDLFKNFTAKTLFGLDFGTGQGRGYGFRNFESNEINSSNSMSRSMFSNRNWVWSNTLSYNQEFGDHRVNALIGTEARRNTYDGFNAGGNGLVFGDDPNYRILTNTNSKTWNLGEYRGEVTIASMFAQVGYNYQDKYLVSGTVRRDGVSRFINNPYGVFPAGSIGWRVSKEEFMKTVSQINDLKLRASYGVTGNNEVRGDYPGFSNYGQDLSNTAYPITGSPSSVTAGFAQNSTGNPDLRWETTSMLNLGVDARLFNAFDVTFEWYDRKTSDILYNVQQPTTAGNIGSIPQNIGDMRNVGYDISIGYRGKAVNNQLTFNVLATAGHYKNTMTRIDANDNTFIAGAGSRIGNITRTLTGQPISQFWGYISDGVIQSNESSYLKEMGDAKVGRLKFRDVNGDGKITDADEGIIGSPLPKLVYGLNLTANYKNFDFTMFFQGVYGNQLFNYLRYFTDFPAFQANYSKNMLYEAGKTYPALDRNDNYSSQRSSFYVEPGSYFRGKNLTLGYTLPNNLSGKIGLDKVRVYLQAQNLFTITKYSGLDPDVTIVNVQEGYNSGRDLEMGVDNGRYPIARTIFLGLNVEF
ncbi:MAG: TonB-dependent receptor [Spirosomaceae bacterium]|nr:TonB-dependent receptor [Spirosomataceae bacterium]